MKERMLTGARPTGKLHLGHYVGALKNQVELQEKYETFYIVSDVHMLTTKSDKQYIDQMYQNTIDMIIDCIGIGMDPNKTTFYLQSNIPEQNNIFCLIQNLIDVKRVEDTPSLREMSKHSKDDTISLGLVAYPVLEAADIIGIGATMVPVGKDNIDHILVTQEIIKTFNRKYGTNYPLPDFVTSPNNHVVGIDGENKMSKSLNNAINIRDSEQEVKEKINRMKWADVNSEEMNVVIEYIKIFCEKNEIYNNILNRYKNGEDVKILAKSFLEKNINNILAPMRNRMKPYIENPELVIEILKQGTIKARKIIRDNYKKLRSEMGMVDLNLLIESDQLV